MEVDLILSIALVILGGTLAMACYFWGKADGYSEARRIYRSRPTTD